MILYMANNIIIKKLSEIETFNKYSKLYKYINFKKYEKYSSMFDFSKLFYTVYKMSDKDIGNDSMYMLIKNFYKMLNFPKDVETAFDQIFSGLPREFFAFDPDELINPCSRNYSSTDDNDLDAFRNALLTTSVLNLADKEDKNG